MSVPPKTRMPLRYRAQYSDRASVYKHGGLFPWRALIPGLDPIAYTTHDEAVHDAHMLAAQRREQHQQYQVPEYEPEYSAPELPPIATVQALMQRAWA